MGPCAALGLLLAAVPASGPARAQTTCDESDLPMVSCTGMVMEGYEADQDGIDLTVSGTMTNGTKTDTIRLKDQSFITIEGGSQVENTTAGGVVAAVGEDGDVTNLGEISVEGVGGIGIFAGDRSTVFSGVDSIIDLIAADTVGIRVLDGSLDVTNDGSIGGEQSGSFGIWVGSNNVVTNSGDGSITLSGTGTIGLLIEGTGNLVNQEGAVTVRGADAYGAVLASDNILINLGNNAQDNGISVEGTNSRGVWLLGTGQTLQNQGDISASGDGSVGVLVQGGGLGATVVNLGRITGDAESRAAVSFEGSAPGRLNILEAGLGLNGVGSSILGEGDYAVLGGDSAEFLMFNAGTITGNVDLGDGDDTLQLADGNFVLGSMPAVTLGLGDDTFVLLGAGTAEGGTFSKVSGDDGSDGISLVGGGPPDTLDLSTVEMFEHLDVFGGDWTLQGSETFDEGIFVNGGILRIDDPVALTGNMTVGAVNEMGEPVSFGALALSDTLELTGDYTHQPGSTFAVALGSGGNGLLDVTGTATIADGAILGVIEETPLSGSFTILSASGGIGGTFTDLPEATPVLSFSLATVDTGMGQDLVLTIDRNSYTAGATTRNQRAVAGALDGVLLGGPDESMQELLASLDRVSFAEYGAALDSLHPEAYDAQTSAMLGFGYTFARLAASNLSECAPAYYPYLPSWITSGPPCSEDGWTPWIGGFGSFGDRNGGSGHVDYSGQGGGVAVGAGRSFGSNWELSGYVGSGFGWLDVDQVGNGSLQTFELGVGAVRRFGPFSLRGVLDYGHGWHQQDRLVRVGAYEQRPSGEYQSNRVTGMVEAAWQLVAAETNFFEPVGSVDFTWLDQDSFKESGGSGANLAVGARSNTVVSTTLGIRLVRTFLKGRYTTDWAQWANGTWRPELDVRWRANWTDVDRDISASFANGPQGAGRFTVKGQDAKQGAEFSIGTTYQPYKTQALVTAGYRGFIGDGTQTHIVGAEVRIPF